MKCTVCNTEFEPIKDNKYIVLEKNLFGNERLYDCFDCPKCGCQCLGKVRIPQYEPLFIDCGESEEVEM